MFTEDDLVYSFTRADALAEGLLIDITQTASEAGFRVPVTISDTAWAECVAWPEGTRGGWGQSESGRLWDVVWMAAQAARRARHGGRGRVEFQVLRVPQGKWKASVVTLVMAIGPGDEGEPVATLMLPEDE